MNITHSFEEKIQLRTKYEFTRILKERIKKNALIYLTGKQVKKGKEIEYSCLEMASAFCGEIVNIAYMYTVKYWVRNTQEKNSYEKIFNENINQQIKVYQLVRQNLEEREICI